MSPARTQTRPTSSQADVLTINTTGACKIKRRKTSLLKTDRCSCGWWSFTWVHTKTPHTPERLVVLLLQLMKPNVFIWILVKRLILAWTLSASQWQLYSGSLLPNRPTAPSVITYVAWLYEWVTSFTQCVSEYPPNGALAALLVVTRLVPHPGPTCMNSNSPPIPFTF